MNKAFVKEPEQGDEQCPRCGSIGQSVGRHTMERYVGDAAATLADRSNFCPKPTCDVVYFDMFERYILCSALILPAYPKDPTAPICACFGFTERDADADIAEGGRDRTRAVVERAKSSESRCEMLAANGRCCVAEVQRYFMKRLQVKPQ